MADHHHDVSGNVYEVAYLEGAQHGNATRMIVGLGEFDAVERGLTAWSREFRGSWTPKLR